MTDEERREAFDKYFYQVIHFIDNSDADEKLMRHYELQMGIPEVQACDFRRQLVCKYATIAYDNALEIRPVFPTWQGVCPEFSKVE